MAVRRGLAALFQRPDPPHRCGVLRAAADGPQPCSRYDNSSSTRRASSVWRCSPMRPSVCASSSARRRSLAPSSPLTKWPNRLVSGLLTARTVKQLGWIPVWDPLWPVDVGRRQAGQRRRARHRHVRGLDFSIEIVESDIVREADGIAISSRNVHPLPEKREKVLSLSRSLVNARTAVLNNNNSASEHIKDQIVQTLTEAGGRVDYVEMN